MAASVFQQLPPTSTTPFAADGLTLTPVLGGALRFGGQSYGAGVVGQNVFNSNEAWLFDGQRWVQLTYAPGGDAPPEPRTRHCAVPYGGDGVLVALGRHTETNTAKWYDVPPDVFLLNVTTASWRRVPVTAGTPPAGRSGAACARRGDSLLVYGGVTVSGDLLGDAVAFHVPTGTWAPLALTGTPPVPLYGAASAYAPDGDAWVLHGGRAAGVAAYTANANVLTTATVALFDGSPDTVVDGGGGGSPTFAGIRGAWVPLPVTGYAPSRAMHNGAYLPVSRRLCVYGGINTVSWGDTVDGSLLCVQLGGWLDAVGVAFNGSAAGSGGDVGSSSDSGGGSGNSRRALRAPASRELAAAPPAVAWRQLTPSTGEAQPRARFAFGAAAVAPVSLAGGGGVGGGNLFQRLDNGSDALLVFTSGRDADTSVADTWSAALPPANASGLWADPVAPGSISELSYLSYISYGIALFLLSMLCLLMLLRHSRLAAVREQRRATSAASAALLEAALIAMLRDGRILAAGGAPGGDTGPSGLDPVIIDRLPTVVFSKPPGGGGAGAAQQQPPVPAASRSDAPLAVVAPAPAAAFDVEGVAHGGRADGPYQRLPPGSPVGSTSRSSSVEALPDGSSGPGAASAAASRAAVATAGAGATASGAGGELTLRAAAGVNASMSPATGLAAARTASVVARNPTLAATAALASQQQQASSPSAPGRRPGVESAGATSPSVGRLGSAQTAAFDPDSQSECSICLSDFEGGDVLKVLPACLHAFHDGCIRPWLLAHTSCPLCKQHVMDGSV